MADLKVYVREDNTATLVCPSCQAAKNIEVGRYRYKRHTFSVRCRCQKVFSIQLDFRRSYRKHTSLVGTYETISGGSGGGMLNINNISRTGLGFSVSGIHSIEKGQLLQIEFQLNDKKKSVLNKQAIVRRVSENSIGCEFKCNAEHDKALGFFLHN